jgi:NADH dehydrogenase [ubiquinone] 1 alpha subcomplex assembly factor 7
MIRRLFSTIKVVKESQTELGKILTSSIKAGGPLTTAHYMRMCLTHPIHGYYMQRDVFGKDGDFTTSPEISQVYFLLRRHLESCLRFLS